jgi:hypothetical protein
MEVEGRLEGRRDYTIHGGPYSQLFFSLPDDPETVHQCQLPDEAVDRELKAGDPIVITFLMRTVMEVRKRPTV